MVVSEMRRLADISVYRDYYGYPAQRRTAPYNDSSDHFGMHRIPSGRSLLGLSMRVTASLQVPFLLCRRVELGLYRGLVLLSRCARDHPCATHPSSL